MQKVVSKNVFGTRFPVKYDGENFKTITVRDLVDKKVYPDVTYSRLRTYLTQKGVTTSILKVEHPVRGNREMLQARLDDLLHLMYDDPAKVNDKVIDWLYSTSDKHIQEFLTMRKEAEEAVLARENTADVIEQPSLPMDTPEESPEPTLREVIHDEVTAYGMQRAKHTDLTERDLIKATYHSIYSRMSDLMQLDIELIAKAQDIKKIELVDRMGKLELMQTVAHAIFYEHPNPTRLEDEELPLFDF